MTKDADLKRIIRDRMAATGESYTQARAQVLATAPPVLTTRSPATDPGRCDASPSVPADPFYDKTIRSFFDGGRLTTIPTKRRARAAVLVELALRFERGRAYAEREVNDILGAAHEDYAFLRRELVEYHYLDRSDGIYRRTEAAPERTQTELQEVPVSEAARLGWA